MTKEEKELLLRDLCARLPHGVKVEVCVKDKDIKSVDCVKYDTVGTYIRLMDDENFSIKPFLSSMSSMTKKEYNEYEKTLLFNNDFGDSQTIESFDWLNSHHFDYRGLIEKGLALEAPEGMYNTKTK